MPKIPDFAFYQLMHLLYVEVIHLFHEPFASTDQLIEAISLVVGENFSKDL